MPPIQNSSLPGTLARGGLSLLSGVGLARDGLSLLSGVGNVIDLPHSMLRDVATLRNPFDQLLDPFGGSNRITTRDALRQYGLISDKDTWANFLGSLALEVGTDPLNAFVPGLGLANPRGALTNAGKVAQRAGVLDEALRAATHISDARLPTMGSRQAIATLTPNAIAAALPGSEMKMADAAAKMGLNYVDIAREPLGGLAALRTRPYGKTEFVLGAGRDNAMMPLQKAMDAVSDRVRWSAPVRTAAAMFDYRNQGFSDRLGQETAQRYTAATQRIDQAVRASMAPHIRTMQEAGVFGDYDKENAVWKALEGVTVREAANTATGMTSTPFRFKAGDFLAKDGTDLTPKMQQAVDDMRNAYAAQYQAERLAGLDTKMLDDYQAEYAARSPQYLSGAWSKGYKGSRRVLPTRHPFQQMREDAIRNIPGGTATLQKLSVDPEFSGVVHSMRPEDVDSSFWKSQVEKLKASPLYKEISPERPNGIGLEGVPFAPVNAGATSDDLMRMAKETQGQYMDSLPDESLRTMRNSGLRSFNGWMTNLGGNVSVADINKAAELQRHAVSAPPLAHDVIAIRQLEKYPGLADVKVGEQRVLPITTATSIDPKYSQSATGLNPKFAYVQFEVPKGANGLFVNASKLADLPHEHELVLPIGTRVEIMGRETVDGAEIIRARVIPGGVQPIKAFNDLQVGDTIGNKIVVEVGTYTDKASLVERFGHKNVAEGARGKKVVAFADTGDVRSSRPLGDVIDNLEPPGPARRVTDIPNKIKDEGFGDLSSEERLMNLVKWAGNLDPEHVAQRTPVFQSPLVSFLRRMEYGSKAIEGTNIVTEVLAKAAKGASDPGDVRVDELLKNSGLTSEAIANVNALMEDKGLVAGNAWVSRETANSVSRVMRPFQFPDEVEKFLEYVWDPVTALYKGSLTTPWLAFHNRNFTSGQIQNLLTGAYKSVSSGKKAVSDMSGLLRGKAIDDAAQLIGRPGMDSEQATKELADMMFSLGVTGKHGVFQDIPGPEGVTGRVPSVVKEIPGLFPAQPTALDSIRQAGREIRDAKAADWNPLKQRGVSTADNEFILSKIGDNLGHFYESLNRGAPFIDLLRQGYSPEEAARRVKAVQVDYSTMSATEKMFMKRLFPFYSFSKGMATFMVDELSSKPGGRMAQMIRASNLMKGDAAGMPDYVAQSTSIDMGETSDGSRSYITGLGLMHEDPLSLGSIRNGRPTVRDFLMEVISRSHPIPKAAAEWATGESFFQRGPMGGRDLVDMDPTVGRILANVGLSSELPSGRAKPFISDGVEHLLANSPLARILTTTRVMTDPRKLEGWLFPADKVLLRLATGVSMTDVSPGAQDAVIRDEVFNQIRESGGNIFTRAYFPKDAPMTDDQLQLSDLARMLAERAKARAAAKKAAMQQAQ